MTALIEKFRTSFISAVFELATKVWWKYVVASFIQGVVVIMAMIPLLLSVLNWDNILAIASNPEAFTEDLARNPEMFFSFLGPDPDYTSLIIAGLLFSIVALIAQAWVYNIYLKLNQSQALEGSSDLGKALSRSFDGKLLPLIGASLVLSVILIALMALNGLLWFVHWSFGLLTLFPALFLIVRTSLVYTAIVHGNRGIGEAIGISFAQINWRRSAILFGAGMIAIVSMVFALFLLSLFLMVFALIPIIGPFINFAFNTVVSGFFNALMFGAMTGLWYRYNDPPEESADQISKHLISDPS